LRAALVVIARLKISAILAYSLGHELLLLSPDFSFDAVPLVASCTSAGQHTAIMNVCVPWTQPKSDAFSVVSRRKANANSAWKIAVGK
jgi:hypothetical protein